MNIAITSFIRNSSKLNTNTCDSSHHHHHQHHCHHHHHHCHPHWLACLSIYEATHLSSTRLRTFCQFWVKSILPRNYCYQLQHVQGKVIFYQCFTWDLLNYDIRTHRLRTALLTQTLTRNVSYFSDTNNSSRDGILQKILKIWRQKLAINYLTLSNRKYHMALISTHRWCPGAYITFLSCIARVYSTCGKKEKNIRKNMIKYK